MIISRTPLRISFAGGGTDLPSFYQHEEGVVVSTAINKYVYINVNEKFDRKIRASYSVTEIVEDLESLKHPLIRECLRLMGVMEGIEITSISDIPSEGSGLGSSSSYTVGLLNALSTYQKKSASAARLAEDAIKVEVDICHEPIGKQDQYIAAIGGVQLIRFLEDGSVTTQAVNCAQKTKNHLEKNLLLLYTGITRSAREILREQKEKLSTETASREVLKQMKKLAFELYEALLKDDLSAFGEILHESWLLKTKLASGVTTQQINDWYNTARKSGAKGGKILGAGGGGFMLLVAAKEEHPKILRSLPQLHPVPFKFESEGSKIVYHN